MDAGCWFWGAVWWTGCLGISMRTLTALMGSVLWSLALGFSLLASFNNGAASWVAHGACWVMCSWVCVAGVSDPTSVSLVNWLVSALSTNDCCAGPSRMSWVSIQSSSSMANMSTSPKASSASASSRASSCNISSARPWSPSLDASCLTSLIYRAWSSMRPLKTLPNSGKQTYSSALW